MFAYLYTWVETVYLKVTINSEFGTRSVPLSIAREGRHFLEEFSLPDSTISKRIALYK